MRRLILALVFVPTVALAEPAMNTIYTSAGTFQCPNKHVRATYTDSHGRAFVQTDEGKEQACTQETSK